MRFPSASRGKKHSASRCSGQSLRHLLLGISQEQRLCLELAHLLQSWGPLKSRRFAHLIVAVLEQLWQSTCSCLLLSGVWLGELVAGRLLRHLLGSPASSKPDYVSWKRLVSKMPSGSWLQQLIFCRALHVGLLAPTDSWRSLAHRHLASEAILSCFKRPVLQAVNTDPYARNNL